MSESTGNFWDTPATPVAPAEVGANEVAETDDALLAGAGDAGEGEYAEPDDVGEGDSVEGDEGAEDGDEPAGEETYTLKVDGEEVELTLDELKSGYGRMRSATKRFQEAAQLQKQIQGFMGNLKSGDPEFIEAMFAKIGVDFTPIAEAHLARYLEEMDAPEHVRGKRQLERERAAFEAERKRAAHEREEYAIEQQAAQELTRMRSEATAELERHGLPANPTFMAKVAREMEQALTDGYPMTMADAAAIVAEETKALMRRLDPATASRLMGGQGAVDQVRRAEAQRAAQSQKRAASQVAKGGARGRGGPQRSAPQYVPAENMDAVKALFDS